MTKAEWSLDIGDEDEPTHALYKTVEVELDELHRPLMARAGILDLNRALDALPEDALRKDSYFGTFGLPFDVAMIVNEVRSALLHSLNKNEVPVGRYGQQGEHYMYPIVSDGFIAQIIQTDIFRRQLGIPQLGMRPSLPLPNEHSRGEHSTYVTINMIRSLQTLADTVPDRLEARLRSDFEGVDFYDLTTNQEDLFNLAADLAVLAGTIHDAGIPAGGDTIKHLLGLNEEEEVEWLFFGDHSVLDEQRREFYEALRSQGLDMRHLRFVVDCIRGKSTSLIGDMIHPNVADTLDWDRIGYTLLDAQEGTLLKIEIPRYLIRKKLMPEHDIVLTKALNSAIEVFEDERIVAVTGLNLQTLSTSIIDPTEDVTLDEKGRLVNTRPDKLAWVAALRMMMIGYCYNSGKMLGYEARLQRRLQELLDAGVAQELLSRENVITLTTPQLFERLRALKDPQLNSILTRFGEIGNDPHFASEIVAQDFDASNAFAVYPISMKPGLDTMILHRGRTMTLAQYCRENMAEATAHIRHFARKFQNARVAIYERPEGSPHGLIMIS